MSEVRLGIRHHTRQFLLLVLSTVFVGMMIGTERTVVPLLGRETFHLKSATVILAFIVTFGLVKSILNLAAGHWSDRIGRKRLLALGWLFGLPVPFLLAWAPSWAVVILANVFLGVNQALAWTMTVTSQIDIAGPKQRGLAMGINEATGYLGVALATALTGALASRYGLRLWPFVPAAVVSVLALLLSLFWIRDTRYLVRVETDSHPQDAPHPSLTTAFWETTWKNPTLSAITQAGLVNKLADTLAWGVLPLFLAGHGLAPSAIGLVSGTYAGVWGFLQFGTGALSDRIGRKIPVTTGMFLLGIGLLGFPLTTGLPFWLLSATVMGGGMALLYPNLNSAVGDVAPPTRRGAILGVYRLWRDGGYAVGGLLIGSLIGTMGMTGSFYVIGAIVLLSSLVLFLRMKETHRVG